MKSFGVQSQRIFLKKKKITPTSKAQGSMPKSGQKDCMNQRIRGFTEVVFPTNVRSYTTHPYSLTNLAA